MTANERRACEGLLPDDAPIADSMEWLRQHCERLAWELESTTKLTYGSPTTTHERK